MDLNTIEVKNKKHFLDKFLEHARNTSLEVRKKYMDEIQKMISDPKWEKRYFGFDLFKNIIYSVRKEYNDKELINILIKGLSDTDGRVRNNAYYSSGKFFGLDSYEDPEPYVSGFFTLYEKFKKQNNQKIKKTFARAIREYNCPVLYDLMEARECFEDYCQALDEVDEFLGIEDEFEFIFYTK